MILGDQLDLIPVGKYEHLYSYWRDRMDQWICDVRRFRHAQNSTGWSMACQGFSFALHLFACGQMDRAQFKRYWSFNRRVQWWDKRNFTS